MATAMRQPFFQFGAINKRQVGRRQFMLIGHQAGTAASVIDQHHATTTGILDVEALDHAGINTPVTDHDFARKRLS